jgi:hypothetical protein
MNTSKILIPLFLIFFLPKILRGQVREDFSDYGPKMSVKINLMAIFDVFEPTFAASFEHRIKGNHYLEHEFGYVYDNPSRMNKLIRGLRYRLGYHYAYEENKFGYKTVGLQIHYRQLFGEIEDFVWRKGNGFQQKLKQKNMFHSYGFTVVFGKVKFLRNDRWFTDFQVGMGLSWKPFKIDNYPADGENPNYAPWIYNSREYVKDGNTLRNGENPIYLNMLMTLKIGYVIR